MTITFRTTRQVWLRFIAIALSSILLGSGLVVLAALAVRLETLPAKLAEAGFMLACWGIIIAIIWAGFGIISRARICLQIDAQTISGKFGRDSFNIYWRDVLAAQLSQERTRCWLLLVTPETDLKIGLGFLDTAAIWQLVQDRVPPAALEEGALQQSPRYQAWVVRREQLIKTAAPLQVRHWVRDVLLVVAMVAAYLLAAALAWQSVRPLAVALLILSLLTLAGIPWVESAYFDTAGVHHRTLLRRRSLLWEDVRWIELRKDGRQLVFFAEGTTLAIPGPARWPEKKRRPLIEFLQAEIECRQIEMRPSGQRRSRQ
jgi:hypothetical protein